METSLQVIDAFIDGERVDSAALKAALGEAEGRDYFVDAWLMREAVHAESAVSAPAPAPVAAAPAAHGASAHPRRTPPRWLIAAAMVAGLIGGYALGYRTTGRTAPPASTPAVAASVQPAPNAFPVPAPTRVIQLEFHPATVAGGN